MDKLFRASFFSTLFVYFILIVVLLVSDCSYITFNHWCQVFRSPEIQYAFRLSLITSIITAVLSLCISIPSGYLLARWDFPCKNFIDAVLDLPIIMPPLIVGISLLVFFQTTVGVFLKHHGLDLVYSIPGIVLAQFVIACAFSLKTIKAVYENIDYRLEDVAKSLGCSAWQAFLRVSLPLAKKGIIAGGVISWARAVGEFGPVIVFCGATRFKTEVLPTTIFLELSIGNIETALAASMMLIMMSLIALLILRVLVHKGVI